MHSRKRWAIRLTICAAVTMAAAAIAALPVIVPVVLAQAPEPAANPGAVSLRSSAREVIVPVTVTSSKGLFLSDLAKSDFHVFDEGKEQTLTYFSHEEKQPVVIGFLLDMSNGMQIEWGRYKDSTQTLILSLLPGDPQYAGYLITYGNSAELAVDTTSNSGPLLAKLEQLKPGGGSALFDAVYMACTSRKTVHGEPYEPRRVLVVIGDGHDTASSKSLAEAVEIAQRNQVTIFAMSTVAWKMDNQAGDENLKALTSQTGGRIVTPLNDVYKDVAGYFSVPNEIGTNQALEGGQGAYTAELADAINGAVEDMIGEITTQYVLRYTPVFAPGTEQKQYRHIEVKVDNLPGVTVRAREGYYPFDPPQ